MNVLTEKKACVILVAIVVNTFSWSCSENTRTASQNHKINNARSANDEIHIELQEILRLKTSRTVNVLYDDYFQRSKEYLGYNLLPIIDSIIKSKSFDTTNSLIIFECHDGYKPSMPLAKLYNGAKPYIVFKDLNEKTNKNWPDSIQNKFNPYYLVWDSVKKEDHSFVWPYGLTRITLTWMEVQYKSIYPVNDVALVGGFNLFRDNCMKCHSLNGVGGSMAQELNFPRNITEYWKDEDIVSFSKNPKSYRMNSTMPPITNIQDSDFNKIISYLKYLKDYKVKDGL